MKIEYKNRHIETERKFYQMMNKQKTFILTLGIVGLGSFFLYIQLWSIKKPLNLMFWTLIIGILFVVQTMIGYHIFEYERKKYIN